MKYIFTLICSCIILSASAQYDKATIILKDGSEIHGLVKNRFLASGIKFKKDHTSEAVVYEPNKLQGINKNGERLRYMILKGDYTPLLLKIENEGFYDLYSQSVTVHAAPAAGFGGVGGFSYGGSYTDYYIKTSGGLVKLGRRLKKKHLKTYFNDCPELTEKLKSRRVKRRQINRIVRVYNSCQKK